MPLQVTYEGGVPVIRIDGLFDADGAAKLRALVLSSSSDDSRIVIDFTKAREITDIALAGLLDLVKADERTPVRFRGLAERHNRMLRLLAARDHSERQDPSSA